MGALRPRSAVPAGDRLEPLGGADLTMLASDCGPAPMHLAAVLVLDGADDGTPAVPRLLARRAAAVPRLTQVLVGPARPGGRPAWWRDPAASPAGHVATVELASGGERAVLDEAARLACAPLDPARPMWAARWLTGWDTTGARRGALVVVLHHVLVDGIGGLGVLGALADPEAHDEPTAAAAAPGHRGPSAWLHGLRELHVGVPRLAARTSINRPTGPSRRVDAARVPLAAFRDGAHRLGGTINDAMVAAAVGALERLLAARGERPGSLVVSVPVNSRPAGDQRPGNSNGVLPVAVPTGRDLEARVRHVAAATARRKARPRGRSALPLGAAFRGLAALGLFRPFIEHQRLVHTFETNVRGPAHRLRLAGFEVSAVLPVAVSPGNVAASFAALSYAGELVACVVTDPSVVPEGDELAGWLSDELGAVARTPAPGHDEGPAGAGPSSPWAILGSNQ